ncbi:MAG: hypothetical protein H7Z13_20205 [Ferruginibacter sp.]|nr:hypothetical protein [Ferruginibacter sp.]
MLKIFTFAVIAFLFMAVQGCSKKAHPTTTVTPPVENKDSTLPAKRIDSLVVKKAVIKRKPKESIPKVIVVNDKFANKSVDGRYYYDLQGHRYWRNNKDGKYYLFNKSMLTDKAFKKPD